MGYDLYITRADHTWETQLRPISEQEWRALAESDPTLQASITDYTDRRLADGTIERVHPWLYVTHPERRALWYYNGAISTKDPDTQLVVKMVQLADRLQAHVIGDEGEVYDQTGQPIASTIEVTPAKKSRWQRLLKLWPGKQTH
jgi:hypothetical protein